MGDRLPGKEASMINLQDTTAPIKNNEIEDNEEKICAETIPKIGRIVYYLHKQ